MVELREFTPADGQLLAAWIANPTELLMWAGPTFTWPLDPHSSPPTPPNPQPDSDVPGRPKPQPPPSRSATRPYDSTQPTQPPASAESW